MNVKKKVFIVGLEIIIAVVFVVGAGWAGEGAERFFKSYFADIAIPFAFYFLLALNDDKVKVLKKWHSKSLIVFAMCSLSEILQYFGIYALATVFDPFDFLMYGLGAMLAAIVDRQIFRRAFGFWS